MEWNGVDVKSVKGIKNEKLSGCEMGLVPSGGGMDSLIQF